MSGGEKILNRIKSDCDERIKEIEEQAEKEYNEVIASAQHEAEKHKQKAEKKALAKVKQINESAESRAQLEIRNAVLRTKRAEIDKTVSAVLEHMLNLPDGEYFELLYKLASIVSKDKPENKSKGLISGVIEKVKEQLSDEILLNSKDLARLPRDFDKRMRASGVYALVSPAPVEISGGFILKRGEIEENMDFEAIISAKRDELEDLINRELFAQ